MALYRKSNSPYHWYDVRVDGVRHRGSTKQKTKQAAQTFEANLLLQLEAGNKPTIRSKMPTVREFGARFLAYFNEHQQRDDDTKRYYRFGMKHLLNTKIANMRLDRVSTSIVSTLAFPNSASTGNAALRTLSRMLRQAVEWEVLRSVPRIHLYKEKERSTTFAHEQEKALLAVAPQPLHDVFLCLMDTGLRPDEVYSLTWAQVFWERNSIFVEEGKTDNAKRYVGMTNRVREALAARFLKKKTDWVFPSRVKKVPHIRSVNKAFAIARGNANLPASLVLYSARHTFGTDLMMLTGNSKLVMVTMGHGDLKTSGRYQHPSSAGVADVLNKRNELRQNKKSMPTLESGHTLGHISSAVH